MGRARQRIKMRQADRRDRFSEIEGEAVQNLSRPVPETVAGRAQVLPFADERDGACRQRQQDKRNFLPPYFARGGAEPLPRPSSQPLQRINVEE